MPISFFYAKQGGLYAAMENTTLDEQTYDWLGRRGVALGRKSAFIVSRESPVFMDLSSAEEWLRKNSFLLVLEDEDDEPMTVDPGTRPTQTQYEECARIATEFREDVAGGTLMDLLRRESRHALLCKVGVRYWTSGFRLLALLAFERSLALCPEPATYFNLAVCRDDMGRTDLAAQAIARFYELVKTPEERSQAEAALKAYGKHHLIRDETHTVSEST
jgi:hypothetical protein